MSGQSWDHAIVKLDTVNESSGDPRRCTAGRNCKAVARFDVSYRYVTGRAGRTTRANKAACLEHAAKFATTNHLQFNITSPVLEVHDWRPVPESDQLQQCSKCKRYRSIIHQLGTWITYQSDSDLSVCVPQESEPNAAD